MLKKTLIFTLIFLASLQLISVDKTNPKTDEQLAIDAPQDVKHILKKGCYDCHSNETKWPYYSNIAPVSFFVASHVKNGRKALNFSTYKEINKDIKEQRLKRAIMTVNNGMMALPSYLSVHDDAVLDKEEKKILTKWFEKELELL
jgi:uncharacterized membrane protein